MNLSVNAQKTHFGLKGGMNLSSVSVSNDDDFGSKIGFNVGALAHIHVTSHFAVQPEVVYSLQGGQVNDFRFKLGYINVPVLAQYMVNDGFRLETGPQVGFLLSGKTEINDVVDDVKDGLSTVDFSWAFGAGYLFHCGVGIDARYNLGISNITESEGVVEKNKVFQFGLFYQFMNHSNGKKK